MYDTFSLIFVQFVVDPAGPAFDLEVPLEVTIGTIPLRTYFNDYNAAAAQAGYNTMSAWSSAPAAGAPPIGLTPVDPSAPPPPMMPQYAPPDARK